MADETDEPGLGGGVGRYSHGHPGAPGFRGDGNDAPVALLDHAGQYRVTAVHQAVHVQAHEAFPVRRSGFEKAGIAHASGRYAGVGDVDIDGAGALTYGGNHLLHLLVVGDVRGGGKGLEALAGQLLGSDSGALWIVIVDRHRGTQSSQGFGDAEAHAATCAGDHGHAAVEREQGVIHSEGPCLGSGAVVLESYWPVNLAGRFSIKACMPSF
ncbi:hypothetical protein D3C85_1145230 [compost metagenome]